AVNDHNTSIQATTRSVHQETVRIVDAQMKDMAVQMQALDGFVTRARSQNGRHHDIHLQSLKGLASTVRQSYSNVSDYFISSSGRMRDLGSDVSSRTSVLQASLPPLDASVRQPLAELRMNIAEAPLKEYIPTGETPQKIQYQYPTTVPRTDDHEKLLAKLNRPIQSEPPALASPSKSMVYNDAEDDVALLQPTDEHKPTSGGGLREVDVNVKAALPRGEPGLAAPTTTPSSEMAPPLKRQDTRESRLPQKLSGKGSVVRLEGRENALPVVVGASGRRLRSSPTG
ncbi:MAG: kinesin motor protein cin8, partial [Pleopsidium flavum]